MSAFEELKPSVAAGDAQETALKPYTIENPLEIIQYVDDPADNWLGDHLLFRGSGGLAILGEGGLGKSRLVLQLAYCAVLGLPFLGLETRMRGKRWLFIQSENGPARLKADHTAMIAAFARTDADLQAIRDGIRSITLKGDDDGYQVFSNPRNIVRIEAAIAGSMANAVVADPLYDKWDEDLNGDAVMRDALNCIRRTVRRGCPDRAPVVLHHAQPGRIGAIKAMGYDRGAFARNSKVIHQWARAQINLFRDPSHPDGEDGDWLVVACGKVSDGRPFSTFGIRLCPQSGVYVSNPDFDLRTCTEALGRLARPGGNLTRHVTSADVASLLDGGALTKKQLADEIQAEFGRKHTAAYDMIMAAEREGLIRRSIASGPAGAGGKRDRPYVRCGPESTR